MIDKSLRYAYRFGGHPGASHEGAGSGQTSGGGRNGSHDRGGQQHRAAAAPKTAPKPEPKSEPTPARETKNPFEETGQTKKEQAKIASDVQELRDKVKTYDQEFTPDLYVDLDKDMEDKGLYSSIDTGPKIDVGFQEALRKQQIATDLREKQQDQDYGQFFRQQPVIEQPRSGIGGALKTAGKGILEMMLMSFLPKPARTALTGYKRAKQLEGIAKRTGILDKDIVPTLNLSNLRSTIDKRISGRQFDSKYDKLNPNEMKNVRTRDDTPTRDGERVAEKTTVQEAIAGEKSLGIDFEDLRKKQMIMKNALDEGYYTDNEGKIIQLTDEQKTVITNYITQIDKYLVDPRAMAADGGRIDKALGGRSRDIG